MTKEIEKSRTPEGVSSPDKRMYVNRIGIRNRAGRLLFSATWAILCSVTPRGFHRWRCWIIRMFGGKIARNCSVYPSAKIWAPWNLTMHEDSCLGDGVECYSVDKITLGARVVVSQRAFLCSASHDVSSPVFELVTSPIVLEENSWVAAEAFVGPGVCIGAGAVVAARAVVVKDVSPWTIVGGNPSQVIGKRAYATD